MTSPAVQFKDVCFSYNHQFVLENINFSLIPHEFVGVIGPNGSGKTTLLKLMLGLLKPDSGTVELSGTTRIGYVPQTREVDRDFPVTVFDLVLSGRLFNLPWYGMYRQEDKDAAREALETVKLGTLSDRAFGTLSTGQAQRVLIARALAAKPNLLVLDEPTASIDPESSDDILRILRELTRSLTIVMVTHNLKTVIQDMNKVLSVQKGVSVMTPQAVCEHFAHGLYHPPLIHGVDH